MVVNISNQYTDGFTKKELNKLEELNSQGLNVREISEYFPNRSHDSIKTKLLKMKLNYKGKPINQYGGKLEEKIAKRLSKEKLTLQELDVPISFIHKMKETGYNIKQEVYDKKIHYWIKTLSDLNQVIISPSHNSLEEIKFVELSDTHAGCLTFDRKGLEYCLKIAEDKGFKKVHFSGDLVDGINVYRHQVNALKYVQEQDQVNDIAEVLSKFKFHYYAIDGNHDYSWIWQGAPSPNALMNHVMEKEGIKYEYLEGMQADMVISGLLKKMYHPYSLGSRGTFTKSYPSQRLIYNLLSPGLEFNVGDKRYNLKMLQVGHFHFETQHQDFGCYITHPGNFQGANDWTTGKGLVGPQGLRLTTLKVYDGEILEYESKWVQSPTGFKNPDYRRLRNKNE